MNPNGNGPGGRGLMGALVGSGADCDAGNSLSHLAKHHMEHGIGQHSDRNHASSSMASGSASSAMLHSNIMRERQARHGQSVPADAVLFDDFIHAPQGSGNAFDFQNLRHELDQSIGNGPQLNRPNKGWAAEFGGQINIHHPHNHQGPILQQQQHRSVEFDQAFSRAQEESMHRMHSSDQLGWSAEFASADSGAIDTMFSPQITPAEREAFEQQWTHQFNAVRETIQGNHSETDVLSPDNQLEWEQEFKKHLKLDPNTKDAEDHEWKTTFDNAWKATGYTPDELRELGLNGEGINRLTSTDWNAEFESMLSRNELANNPSDGQSGGLSDMVDPDPISGPLVPYTFEPENKYLTHPNPLEVGLELLRSNGSLTDAALAFEAHVQSNPYDSTAWMHLGNIQAENEKELPAVAALQRAVQESPSNTDALMSLAVSYTNERQDLQAYATLDRWLTTKYPEIAKNTPHLPEQQPYVVYPTTEFHSRILSMFLAAASEGPTEATGSVEDSLDANLQVGLGLLFYSTDEFEKSVDCFTAALSVRPNDYLLWNRLGATLANSGRSEEAIDAYHRALELKPTFVRCRYNLGIGCINIGCYREAAEHLLGALSMHGVNHRNQANISLTLWDSLRRAFIMMDRQDLADKVDASPDVSAFRDEFEF
ncbi:hypothetical protein BASA83_005787 [Batrachochytrium salamandrivorans]|nr:hypothetical protein BASA62_009363 [Batrachochytrium salamandrivorans]KAH9271949.1 hypothetical protein BASA83_005787 [Batrachochytrium salamandrivorans]